MSSIISLFCNFSDIIPAIKEFISENKISISTSYVINDLNEYLNHLNHEKIQAYIEYPYVDKVYRDSYYHYYSTKNKAYDRNCIRISFFNDNIDWENFKDIEKWGYFRESEKINLLNKSYLGFIIIRPTYPRTIGRSLISPNALKIKNFYICNVKTNVLINGLKLNVESFPHCSQDDETMTCAETTLWTVMEYFSNRYAEYNSILPFKIINALERFSYERQIPSHGLFPKQISFALKEFGFGVRIYNKNVFSKEEFDRILYYYVESGLPVLSIIQDQHYNGHIVTIVGHTEISGKEIENITELRNQNNPGFYLENNIKLFDSADIYKKYVIIDDNHPPFQLADCKEPTKYYNNPDWDKYEITNIIVPLHSKIYLEGLESRTLAFLILGKILNFLKEKYKINFPKEILYRLLLTSSRSFKHQIALNDSLNIDIKDLIIEKPMPKFIWVLELSDKSLFKKEKIFGQMLLDATEASRKYMDALIYLLWPDYFITWENENFKQQNIEYSSFNLYKNNLKHFT